MAQTSAEKQKLYKAKQKKLGRKPNVIWSTVKEFQKLKDFLKKLRE